MEIWTVCQSDKSFREGWVGGIQYASWCIGTLVLVFKNGQGKQIIRTMQVLFLMQMYTSSRGKLGSHICMTLRSALSTTKEERKTVGPCFRTSS